MLSSHTFDAKYKQLNAKQKEAVDAIYGPVMVIAGPGTGKTTVLTLRIANILNKTDAKPEEILALTYTDNGAKNMREKLREIIGDASFRVNIFTFHSFANHIRVIFPECFGKAADKVPADEATKLQILEDILGKQSFKELRVSAFGVSIKKIAGRISDLKRELVTPKKLKTIIAKEAKNLDNKEKDKKEKYLVRMDEFAKVYELYQNELEKRSLYDFDDAITGLVEALKNHNDMAAEIRESFQFVLADEHQDANGAQNEILRMFKAEGVEKPNVFVVGDDKQSIFSFQGASLEHFYNFSKEFEGAQKITLMDNYRSHNMILEASHSLITGDGREHQKLSANVEYKQKKIEVIEYAKYEAELLVTARRVKEILSKRGSRESIAIIARNNKSLFDIALYLEEEGIEFEIAGERSLFEDREYRRLMCLFEALSNPYDGALLKALYAGYFKADISDVLAMANKARKERKDFAALYLAMPENRSLKDLIKSAKKSEVTSFLRDIKSEMQNDLASGLEALRAIFDESKNITKKNRSATLDDLIQHLQFLEKHNLSLMTEPSRTDVCIKLLTVHRAKGLEYDYVFIIDVTSKRFEGSKTRADLLRIPSIGHGTELDEERRLLYVAITRAKKHATISYSLIGDEGANNAPSTLLLEIGEEYVERIVYKGNLARLDMLNARGKPHNKNIYREAFLQRNFSVSALNNFIDCPWKYFFRNLLLVPEAPEFASSLGNACHEILRIFHTIAKKGKILNKSGLKKLVKQCVYSEPFTKSELSVAIDRAEEGILAYAAIFKQFLDKEKVGVEDKCSFVYKVQNGKKNFDITVTGKIDLSLEKHGEIEVIDFKTKKRISRNAIKGETKNEDGGIWRQLQFYKFLLESTDKKIIVTSGTITFLSPERGKVLSETFELTDVDKGQIERALCKALLSIYNLDFWNTTCGKKDCEYCFQAKLLPR